MLMDHTANGDRSVHNRLRKESKISQMAFVKLHSSS